ncbi:MAG: ABC transporter substrate-binding protein, partial [Planctomycetota bacterium]
MRFLPQHHPAMRHAPVLLAVLFVAVGVGLGLRVMLRQQPAVPAAVDSRESGATSSHLRAPAPGGGAGNFADVPQGHVYTGIAEEPTDVNPFTTIGPLARRLLGYTHEALVDADPYTGVMRPALASAFEVAPDGMSCTFTLREGVLFSDGLPLTMADVLFGWELAKAGHLPLGFVNDAFGRVDSVDVLDEHHLRVHYRGVFYATTQVVGEAWVVAQRRWFVDRVAEQARLASLPVPAVDTAEFAQLLNQIDTECGPGTGPYLLHNQPNGESTWRQRQDLLLVRNLYCWRRQAQPGCWNFDGIRILFRAPPAVLPALLAGEIDWYTSTSLDALLASRPELSASYRRLDYDYEALGVYRVVWNCQRPPFDDPRVRRALGLLFDHEALREVFGKASKIAS